MRRPVPAGWLALAALAALAVLLAACGGGEERASTAPAPPPVGGERPLGPPEPPPPSGPDPVFPPGQRPEPLVQFRHSEPISDLAFSPAGEWLATAAGEVKIRTVREGDVFRELPAGRGAVAFSPDGTLLATGGEENEIRLWKTRAWERTAVLAGHRYPVRALAFSPGGTRLASFAGLRQQESRGEGEAGEVKLWDLESGKALWTASTGYSRMLSFSADGTLLAASGAVRNAATGEVVRAEHGVFSPSGRLFASTRIGKRPGSQELVVWDALAWRVLREESFGPVYETGMCDVLAFTPDDGRLFVSYGLAGDGGWTKVVEPRSGRQLGKLADTFAVPLRIACSPDGERVAAVLEGISPPPRVEVRRVRDGEVLWMAWGGEGEHARLQPVSFSPDGRWLVTGIGGVQAWDLRGGQLLGMAGHPSGFESSVAIAARGEAVVGAVASSWGGVRAWDFRGGRLLWEDAARRHDRPPHATGLFLLPDGGLLVSERCWHSPLCRGERAARPAALRDLATGKQEREFPGRSAHAVSPDGRLAVWRQWELQGGEQVARASFWNITTGNPLPTRIVEDVGSRPTFSPDGRPVAGIGRDGAIRVRELASGRVLHTLSGAHRVPVLEIAFSPDGRTLASAGLTVKLWDLESGRVRGNLREHRARVTGLAFSPDGTRLATTSDDLAVRLWDPAAGRLLVTLMFEGADPAPRSAASAGFLEVRQEPWVAMTPEGFFASSAPDSPPFLRWRVGDELFPAERFAEQFHRPGRVWEALTGR